MGIRSCHTPGLQAFKLQESPKYCCAIQEAWATLSRCADLPRTPCLPGTVPLRVAVHRCLCSMHRLLSQLGRPSSTILFSSFKISGLSLSQKASLIPPDRMRVVSSVFL